MQQEALDALDHDAFALAVRDVLEDEPGGLRSVELYAALGREHQAPPMKYLHAQLAALSRAGDIVIDMPNKRYLHPQHADEDPEAYRPRI